MNEPDAPLPLELPSQVTESGARSITTGQDGSGINSTGDGTTNVQADHVTVLGGRLRPITEVPAAAGAIGAPGARLFVGREQELARLRAALTGAFGAGVVVQAVHGLGGIGKTSLVARYVELHATQYSQVVWITADSPASLDSGLAGFATALEPELTGALPTEALRERAISWLCTHSEWLVILDNVTDPADVRTLLARATTGRFLLTTRRATGWHGIAAPLRLDVLDPTEAHELVTRTLDPADSALLVGLQELCKRLGYLPLALEQAAAYIAENQTSAEKYMRLLDQHPAVMYQEAAEGTTAQRTAAQVWAITLDRLADDPLAGHLLRVLAWLAPDAIPRTLLAPLGEEPKVLHAIGKLNAYSMITLDGDHLSVHRLVQAVSRTPDPHDPHRDTALIDQARDTVNTLLHQALPGEPYDPNTWPHWRELTPHVDAYAEHAPEDADTAETSYILDRSATYLENQGTHAQAISHFERALRSSERIHGPQHNATLARRNNLAHAYNSNGDLVRAISLYEQTLTDRERLLGPEHPDTLSSRNNLAGAYYDNGDLDRAIPLYEQTLTDREHTPGPNHPDTLTSRNNLATAYNRNGDLDRAIPLLEQTLTDREHTLGPNHPDTLTSRNNLATAYHDNGDLIRAIHLFEQTLTDAEQTLGPTHPSTLTMRNNLAAAYRATGDLIRAIPLLEQTLTDAEHTLGPNHPTTNIIRDNLESAQHTDPQG
jgi:tetratricopeptide (TPR) repeat protein